jgi:hypothetical protein
VALATSARACDAAPGTSPSKSVADATDADATDATDADANGAFDPAGPIDPAEAQPNACFRKSSTPARAAI